MKLLKNKKLSKLHTAIWMFPFLLSCFDYIYFNLFVMIFSKNLIPDHQTLDSIMTYGKFSKTINLSVSANIFFYAIMVYFWMKPITKFMHTPDDEGLRKTVTKRLENIQISVIQLFVVLFLWRILIHILYFHSVINSDVFYLIFLPSLALSTFCEGIFALLYVNSSLFSSFFDLYQLVYKGNELYELKKGFHISVWKKTVILLISNTLLPIAAISYIILKYDYKILEYQKEIFVISIFDATIITTVGLSLVFWGLWRPLTILAQRMDKVSEGDFTVKTSITQNDNMSRIKHHFNEMVKNLQEREMIKDMFGKYLSIEIAKKLIDEQKLNLGGEKIDAAILFCDIRNFTVMSERLSAQEVVEFLNHYFEYITEPIFNEKGVINKFIGDAVMAFFCPQFGVENYADAAFNAALGMIERLKEFNTEFPEYNTKIGIGIHAGPLVAGNIGTSKRLEYTVIGDTVNAAARIETETKNHDTNLLFSKQLVERLSNDLKHNIKSIGDISVKGKDQNLELFMID